MADIELKILVGLRKNARALDRKTANIAAQYNLSFSQFMVLERLYSKGNMTIGQVRDHILSSAGTIPLIIRNLEKRDYIERLQDENDKRVCILQLTDAGYDVINQIVPENRQMILDYMSVLDQSEKEALLQMLKKIGGKYHGKNSEEKSKRL